MAESSVSNVFSEEEGSIEDATSKTETSIPPVTQDIQEEERGDVAASLPKMDGPIPELGAAILTQGAASMFRCGFWEVVLVATISTARIGMGLFVGSIGPTLLYLASNVNTSVPTLSQIFLGKSLGIVIGGVAGGFLKRKTSPQFRHLYPLGAGLLLLGISCLITPHLKELWTLVFNITVGSIMYGYLDCGLQALLLQLFGQKGSRAYVQLFHFGFSVGAFFGPMLAKPFLLSYDKKKSTKSRCPEEKHNTSFTDSISPPLTEHVFTTIPADEMTDPIIQFDPMIFFYAVVGGWSILNGSIMLILGKLDTEAKVPRSKKNAEQKEGSKISPEIRQEEPLKDVIGFFFCVMAFFYCAVSTENVFYYYLYSVSICSNLSLTIESAALMTSIMWLGLGVGRLTGTIIANYITPRNILLFAIAGSILDSLLIAFLGEKTLWLTWIVAFSHLFTTGMFYPAGVSWTSKMTNVSETYQFIFTIGNSVGGMTMLPLAGYIFGLNPFSVMYQVFTLAVLSAFIFALTLFVAKKHGEFLNKSKSLKPAPEISQGLL